MSQENVEIVRRVYDAAARRDVATVLALYDPDVERDVSLHPLGGVTGKRVYRGHEGLRIWFREWGRGRVDAQPWRRVSLASCRE
jgi:ketosteroid isomerase-like protein